MSLRKSPNITVVTPCYQASQHIELALRSVAPSVESGIAEHIVVDGGSNDGTVDILSSSLARWSSAPDDVQSDALNRAMELSDSRTEYIAWLNADERYIPGMLEFMLEVARACGSDVLYGDYYEITTSGDQIRLVTSHRFSQRVLNHYGGMVPSCTTLIRRDSLESVGRWSVGNLTKMDWELWHKIARLPKSIFTYTGVPHALFTRHDGQATARYEQRALVEHTEICSQFGVSDTPAQRALAAISRRALKFSNGGYFREAQHQAYASSRLFVDSRYESGSRG